MVVPSPRPFVTPEKGKQIFWQRGIDRAKERGDSTRDRRVPETGQVVVTGRTQEREVPDEQEFKNPFFLDALVFLASGRLRHLRRPRQGTDGCNPWGSKRRA